MRTSILLLPLLALTAKAEHFTPPFSSRTDEAQFDGIRVLYIETWGAKGDGSVESPIVPEGEIWWVRGCGIITDDGTPLEYMMQFGAPFEGHLPNPQLLVPVRRETGTAGGTPVLAMEKELILLPNEWMSARVNGLRKDKQMGIRMSVFVFPVNVLSKLLGVE